MDAVADAAVGAQEVEFFALAPDGFEQDLAQSQVGRRFFGDAAVGSALIDLGDFVLVLMEQIVVEMRLMFALGRFFAVTQEVDGGLQEQMAGFSFFADSCINLSKPQPTHEPRQ